MKRRLVSNLRPELLLVMPTKQLLGRLRSLQRCEDAATVSDRNPEEVATSEGILFKDRVEWQRAYAELKAVLATREHVSRADACTKSRQKRANRKSNKTVQRTEAGVSLQGQIERHRRLAPVAGL